MSDGQSLTGLPGANSTEATTPPPNPARDVQQVLAAPAAVANVAQYQIAKHTQAISDALPSFPAARLFGDMVFGWPHYHMHPPNWFPPPAPPAPPIFLPSIGPVILSGSLTVLINGLPAARCGDVGFGAWCGGFFPLFEVFTGSSNVFIGGARASRMLIDFTRHCSMSFFKKAGKHRAMSKFERVMSKFDQVMGKVMPAYIVSTGAAGIGAGLIDRSNSLEAAEDAQTESEAASAMAYAEAAGTEAAMAAAQLAADLAAMALSIGMGKDPGLPPMLCFGNFITGSHNVLIGGIPIPGFMGLLGGLRKMRGRRPPRPSPRRGQNGGCGRVGEPIDIVTGGNVDDFVDFTLPAPRFVWRRWYDSQQQEQPGPLGWGFRHEYQLELKYDQSSRQYTYTDQEGNSVPFPPFATEYPSERVVQHGYVLKRLSERRFELTTHNRPAFEFEFGVMSDLAGPVALRDGDRNFSFDYDGQGRLVGIQLDEVGTIRLAYSPAGLVSEVMLEQPGQEVVYVARYRYDDDNCLVEFRDALDQVARYEYDQAHRMTRKTDRRGYSYRYQYDEQGRCVYTSGEDGMYEIWLEYHPGDRATVVKYSDGGSWTYEYNELGTIAKIVDPYGGTQHRLIDPDTRIVTRELDPAGNPTELLYDELGAHTGRRDAWGYLAPPLDVEPHPADPLEHKVPETPLEWEFGNLLSKGLIGAVSPNDPLLEDFPEIATGIAQSRPPGSVKNEQSLPQEKHDLLGRLIERRNADGSVERWEYDAEGNEVLYVDGDGGIHLKEYKSWNLLHRETDPAGNSCTFQYSPTEEITQFVDAGGALHDFVYDKKDRLVEVRRAGVTYEVYCYDESDNLIEKLDREGRSLLVCEPGFGRLDRIRRFADGEVYQYEYNECGRIVRARTRRDRMTLNYDGKGRPTKDERNGFGAENKFAGDKLVSTTVFGNFVTLYRRRYDGGLIITDPTGRAHTFHINNNGLILKELASGSRELIQYDAKGRCLHKVGHAADGERRIRSYHYSAAGDLVQVEDSHGGAVKYHYDAAHYLKIAEREDGRNELYVHDKAGNLVLQPRLDGVRIGSDNKLKQASGERLHYNHRDNVIRRESEKRTTSYEYDSFDQLVEISLNGRKWQAEYDALGRRARKRWLDQTTEYYWDHDRLSAEIRGDGSVRVYLYMDERALVPFMYVDYVSLDAEPESGTVKYLFTNHLGVPERIEDESGRTIWKGEVSPYGAVNVEIGRQDEIALRFPGHYYDVETGLHYNRFRYYDPILGRYLQCDPLGIAGGYNLYAYLGNPLTSIDILGLHRSGNRSANGHGDERRPARGAPPRGEGDRTSADNETPETPAQSNRGWNRGQIPCFPAGTLVATRNGLQKIENITINDEVYTFDFIDREVKCGKVISVYHGKTNCLVHLKFSEMTLITTKRHPVWIESMQSWIEAEEIGPGMKALGIDCSIFEVKGCYIENLSAPIDTFNLTIDGYNNFFAGIAQLLVHNDDSRMNREGYSNYVLKDSDENIYYSGMFGPNQTQADVERRHAANHNRYNPEDGDTIEVFEGTRTYRESRRLEHETAVENDTYIGRDGDNYRGNRQYPMGEHRFPAYYDADAC
jgi:RHS repeat-associated protein